MDFKFRKLVGKTEDAKMLNSYLDIAFMLIHRDLVDCGITITGELIKEKYFGVQEKPRMLLEIFEHHNKQFAELVVRSSQFGMRLWSEGQCFCISQCHMI